MILNPIKMDRSTVYKLAMVAGLTSAILGFLLFFVSRAATASLYLQPSVTNVEQNTNFNVAIRVNTNGEPVNAIQANLGYSASQLAVVGVNYTGSAFEISAQETVGTGSLQLARGSNPAESGDLLYAVVTFKMLASSGQVAINFGPGTAVIRSTDNQNITGVLSGGNYTATSSTTPPADTQKPTAPGGLSVVSVTTTSASLNWAPSTDNVGVVAYRVYREQQKAQPVLAATVSGSSAVVSGLRANTNYNFFVTAVDAAGNESLPSNTVRAKTARR